MNIGDSISGALFSEDRLHRFVLWRIWDKHKPPFLFVGLNPSTAAELKNDPTVFRLINFGKEWGYGGLFAVNLKPIISPVPYVLSEAAADKYLAQNDEIIKDARNLCSVAVVGWGDYAKDLQTRVKEVLVLLGKPVYCIKVNKSGQPCHPLYLPADCQIITYQ
jgi:hypothetical protein